MKKAFIFIILTLFCFQIIAQEKDISGVVIVYLSKKIPQTHINPPEMYCLDSIRLNTIDGVYPLQCEYLSNEYFAYEPINEKLTKINSTIRNSRLYCTNPKENHIHKGGEVFIRDNNINRLYISFNIKGKGYFVSPNKNCLNKLDSLTSIIEKQKKYFHESEKEELCQITINLSEYIILLNDFISTKLTNYQKREMGFIKTSISEFWRYGCW